jgi:hypothetical protein
VALARLIILPMALIASLKLEDQEVEALLDQARDAADRMLQDISASH